MLNIRIHSHTESAARIAAEPLIRAADAPISNHLRIASSLVVSLFAMTSIDSTVAGTEVVPQNPLLMATTNCPTPNAAEHKLLAMRRRRVQYVSRETPQRAAAAGLRIRRWGGWRIAVQGRILSRCGLLPVQRIGEVRKAARHAPELPQEVVGRPLKFRTR